MWLTRGAGTQGVVNAVDLLLWVRKGLGSSAQGREHERWWERCSKHGICAYREKLAFRLRVPLWSEQRSGLSYPSSMRSVSGVEV